MLGLHACFILCRLLFRHLDLLLQSGEKNNLAQQLFSAAGKLRSAQSKMLFSAILKRIQKMPQVAYKKKTKKFFSERIFVQKHVKLLNGFYESQVCMKRNEVIFFFFFVLSLFVRSEF